MDSFLIEGGTPLRGELRIGGAKNATLPLMAAALLSEETCILEDVPHLSDVQFMAEILRSLGAEVEIQDRQITISARQIVPKGDYELIRKMRGSVCIMGPLLSRLGDAVVALPGGCVIGARPVDLHLKGFRALGAKIEIEEGYVRASAETLIGDSVFLGGRAGPTVLGTINVMMAATLARGVTVIDCAACEPEVGDVAAFLNKMGAKISGAGTPRIEIEGVERLGGATHQVVPDRIETATYAIASVVTDGEIRLTNTRPGDLPAFLDKMREAGVDLEIEGDVLIARRGASLTSVDITTQPHPGFPTDIQAQMMALMTLIPGISIITERIFEARFMHVPELGRLGAEIAVEGPSAIVKGGRPLRGAPVMASDLRASAALVLAGLAASGTTRVNRVYHIDRGYEAIDRKLESLGARIQRVKEV